jgi:hypothetical protein
MLFLAFLSDFWGKKQREIFMCYGWEPDDIVQIITDLKEKNERGSLEIIDKSLDLNINADRIILL